MTSIYPELPQAIPAQAAETVGRVPAFDADQSRFLLRDGALVERGGGEAVKQWFELALRQQIGRAVSQLFDGYKAGMDPEAVPPLLGYELEEKNIHEREWK